MAGVYVKLYNLHTVYDRWWRLAKSQLNGPEQLRDTPQFRRNRHDTDLRIKTLLDLPKVKSAIGSSMFKYAGAKDWNCLPSIFREMSSITSFKRSIYMYLSESDEDSHIRSL